MFTHNCTFLRIVVLACATHVRISGIWIFYTVNFNVNGFISDESGHSSTMHTLPRGGRVLSEVLCMIPDIFPWIKIMGADSNNIHYILINCFGHFPHTYSHPNDNLDSKLFRYKSCARASLGNVELDYRALLIYQIYSKLQRPGLNPWPHVNCYRSKALATIWLFQEIFYRK